MDSVTSEAVRYGLVLMICSASTWVLAEAPAVVPSTTTSTVSGSTTSAVSASLPNAAPPSAPAVTTSTPAVPAASLPGVKGTRPPTSMNEMTGTVSSVDLDERDLRLTVDGGFNVDFTYTSGSSFTDHDAAISASDLVYGDKVVVRYVGRDLVARQIDRLSKAP